MDSNMDHFFNSIESENSSLNEQVTNLESEVFRLTQQGVDLEKALDKQKKFHRKYAEDVNATEKIRVQDFKEEKRTLNEQNKLLVKQNRQLNIDCTFYQKAYEEVAKEKEFESNLTERTTNESTTSASRPVRMARLTTTSIIKVTPERKQKSSKVLSQLSEKLLGENKKLKVKMEGLNAMIKILKSKNLKLENFRKKIDNKKLKFSKDSDELALLVKSTETNNETVFTPPALVKLAQLSMYDCEF